MHAGRKLVKQLITDIRGPNLSQVLRYSEDVSDYPLPRLSPSQVSSIIRVEEVNVPVKHEAVLRFENNLLAANSPIEDRHAEGYCNATDGYLFGVFDGHGGPANAQAVSERLFNYIAVQLLNPELLSAFCERMKNKDEELNLVKFLRHGSAYFSKGLSGLYRQALINYAHENLSNISNWEKTFTMQSVLEEAFVRLDEDFSKEAFPADGNINQESTNIAMSGSCACIAHIDGPHLHTAHVGDCAAVLGVQNDDGTWSAKKLTVNHDVKNKSERARILSGRQNEKGTAIRDSRVLGILEPTRAFGDFKFKLDRRTLLELGRRLTSLKADEVLGSLPRHYFEPIQYYYTPPYVTAKPEVGYHHLRPKDRFLVLGSDGLWNMFPDCENKIIQLVGDHTEGAQTIADFKIPTHRSVTLNELKSLLAKRKEYKTKRAEDLNSATHLIRNALGYTNKGVEHRKISALLTLPADYVRHYRDDITVTVVFFNESYLKNNLESFIPETTDINIKPNRAVN